MHAFAIVVCSLSLLVSISSSSRLPKLQCNGHANSNRRTAHFGLVEAFLAQNVEENANAALRHLHEWRATAEGRALVERIAEKRLSLRTFECKTLEQLVVALNGTRDILTLTNEFSRVVDFVVGALRNLTSSRNAAWAYRASEHLNHTRNSLDRLYRRMQIPRAAHNLPPLRCRRFDYPRPAKPSFQRLNHTIDELKSECQLGPHVWENRTAKLLFQLEDAVARLVQVAAEFPTYTLKSASPADS